MRALRNLLIILLILVVIGFFLPADLKMGYSSYVYGRIVEMTGNTGKAAQAYKGSAEAMPDNATFACAYVRTLNDIAESHEDQSYFRQAYEFAHSWIEEHEYHDGLWRLYIEEARAEWGRGRKNQAKYAIDTAVDLMPTDYAALVYQGIIYRDFRPDNRNSVSRSIRIFEQAIAVRRETRTSWAHYELAVAYYMVRDEVRALNEINQALSQFPPRDLRQKLERLKNRIHSGGRSER